MEREVQEGHSSAGIKPGWAAWPNEALSSSSPPLCGVLTIIYPKQTVFLEYIILQLFCSYSFWYV
jgi:hypothetical protein